jgi:phosphoglycerate dehydrogenase-like enzyme
MKAVITTIVRPLLESHLPQDLDVSWFATPGEAKSGIADADIAWIDFMHPNGTIAETIRAAGPNLAWLSTSYAGLDAFPLDLLRARGVTVTNGAGLNAIAVAEYAVMGVLAAAKRFDDVVRARDRHEWLENAPGKIELFGTKALVIGYGTIGRSIGERLSAFGVKVTGVTRSGRDGTLTPGSWPERLGEFDWVILAAPSTASTKKLIGERELAAMKRSAWLVNIARGDMIDEAPLIAALRNGGIAGAFLDPTDPEPLPAADPLWSAPNTLITMHLSGRSQTTMFARAATLFLENLAAFTAGTPLKNVADLDAGY